MSSSEKFSFGGYTNGAPVIVPADADGAAAAAAADGARAPLALASRLPRRGALAVAGALALAATAFVVSVGVAGTRGALPAAHLSTAPLADAPPAHVLAHASAGVGTEAHALGMSAAYIGAADVQAVTARLLPDNFVKPSRTFNYGIWQVSEFHSGASELSGVSNCGFSKKVEACFCRATECYHLRGFYVISRYIDGVGVRGCVCQWTTGPELCPKNIKTFWTGSRCV